MCSIQNKNSTLSGYLYTKKKTFIYLFIFMAYIIKISLLKANHQNSYKVFFNHSKLSIRRIYQNKLFEQ